MSEPPSPAADRATPRLVAATIDCVDLDGMTTFWSTLLGVPIRAVQGGFGFLDAPDGTGVAIWLQEVPEPAAVKTRIHLDLSAADLDATLQRVRELGGTVGARHEWHGYIWNQCFDPEGNVFDVMQTPPTSGSATDA